MFKSSFELTPDAIRNLDRVKNHLQAALCVKLSRTAALKRALLFLAEELDRGDISHFHIVTGKTKPGLEKCQVCKGAGAIRGGEDEDGVGITAPCPRCSRQPAA